MLLFCNNRYLFGLLFFVAAIARADISVDGTSGFFSRTLKLTQNELLADGNFVAEQSTDIMCSEVFRGRGCFKASTIRIVTKKFAFTGTIDCSGTCEIIAQQPFNQKMFNRKGHGKFTIKIDPKVRLERNEPQSQQNSQKTGECVYRDDSFAHADDLMNKLRKDELEREKARLEREKAWNDFERKRDLEWRKARGEVILGEAEVSSRACNYFQSKAFMLNEQEMDAVIREIKRYAYQNMLDEKAIFAKIREDLVERAQNHKNRIVEKRDSESLIVGLGCCAVTAAGLALSHAIFKHRNALAQKMALDESEGLGIIAFTMGICSLIPTIAVPTCVREWLHPRHKEKYEALSKIIQRFERALVE